MAEPDRDEWWVIANASDAAAYAALSGDQVWNCFAIADLTPPIRTHARYAIAGHLDAPAAAAAMVLRHPAFTMLIPSGDPEGVAAILDEVDLPEETQVQVRAEHLPVLERFYRLRPGRRELLRMGVTRKSFHLPSGDLPLVLPLGPDDLPGLLALYRHYPDGVFRAEHLQHGVFYGADADGLLVAAGGTHIVAEQYGLGVLGSIFTHPNWRGRGYGRAVTAAILAELFARGCANAMLTVGANNEAAIRLYQSLGFTTHCRYWSGAASRYVD